MEFEAYFRMVLALAVVLGLIGLVAWGARRMGLAGPRFSAGRKRRLGVVESLQLDNRRRLVLVRRDGVEHLLLIGGGSDIIVERAASPGKGAGENEETPV